MTLPALSGSPECPPKPLLESTLRRLTPVFIVLIVLAACDSPTGPGGSSGVTFLTTGAQGTPGWLLDDSLEVRVSSARAGGTAGVWVHWSSTTDGAWFSADSTPTGADGVARVAYAPGWALGTQQVMANAASASASLAVSVTGMEFIATEVLDRRVCGLDTDGRMWCWPEYSHETFPRRLDAARRPIPVDTPLRFVALRSYTAPFGIADPGEICAITAAGELWCAKATDFSGPNTVASVPTLHQVATPAPVADYSLLREDFKTNDCMLDPDGRAWCRGDNGFGQLGDGTTTASSDWVAVQGNLRFAEITVGDHDTCAITLNGQPYCWGGNQHSRLGITPEALKLPTPTPIDADIRLKRISQASGGLCGIAAFGAPTLLCWGPTFPADRIAYPAPSGIEGIPTTATSLAGDWAGGRIVQGGRLYRFGYNGGWTADFEFYDDMLEPTVTGIDRLVSRTSYYWCARHETGATICATVRDRPVAVPLPQ